MKAIKIAAFSVAGAVGLFFVFARLNPNIFYDKVERRPLLNVVALGPGDREIDLSGHKNWKVVRSDLNREVADDQVHLVLMIGDIKDASVFTVKDTEGHIYSINGRADNKSPTTVVMFDGSLKDLPDGKEIFRIISTTRRNIRFRLYWNAESGEKSRAQLFGLEAISVVDHL